MKTYLIPTTAQIAVQLNQQLLDVSPVSSPAAVAGGGQMPTPSGDSTPTTD